MNPAVPRALLLGALVSWHGSPVAAAVAAADGDLECGAPPLPEEDEEADVSLLQTSLRVSREGARGGQAAATHARTASSAHGEGAGFTAHLGHLLLTESPASCATWLFQRLQAWAEQLMIGSRGAYTSLSGKRHSSPSSSQNQALAREGDTGPPVILLQEDAGISSRRVSPLCTMLLVFWAGVLGVTLLACVLRVKLDDEVGTLAELPQEKPVRAPRALDMAGPPLALCPPLVLPSNKASFSVLLSALQRLSTGSREAKSMGPVEVFGSSGRALLHARLSQVGSWPSDSASLGICLELTTNAVSSFPHASIGPLRIGMGTTPLLIRRGLQESYGTLDPIDYNRWAVRHHERPLLIVDVDAENCFFTATAANNVLLASASLVKSTAALSQPHFTIEVCPGADCALILLVVLATLLTSREMCQRLAHDAS